MRYISPYRFEVAGHVNIGGGEKPDCARCRATHPAKKLAEGPDQPERDEYQYNRDAEGEGSMTTSQSPSTKAYIAATPTIRTSMTRATTQIAVSSPPKIFSKSNTLVRLDRARYLRHETAEDLTDNGECRYQPITTSVGIWLKYIAPNLFEVAGHVDIIEDGNPPDSARETATNLSKQQEEEIQQHEANQDHYDHRNQEEYDRDIIASSKNLRAFNQSGVFDGRPYGYDDLTQSKIYSQHKEFGGEEEQDNEQDGRNYPNVCGDTAAHEFHQEEIHLLKRVRNLRYEIADELADGVLRSSDCG
ncbi:hypothetical protein F4777DRAFT_578497 [Nemania sp. FL0916]|nr:hypothetical protein F4777DRAFT_578497 [Nemania sp. FL0916]